MLNESIKWFEKNIGGTNVKISPHFQKSYYARYGTLVKNVNLRGIVKKISSGKYHTWKGNYVMIGSKRFLFNFNGDDIILKSCYVATDRQIIGACYGRIK